METGIFISTNSKPLERIEFMKRYKPNDANVIEYNQMWLNTLIAEAHGFGSCSKKLRYIFPHDFLFELKTNIVNLKTWMLQEMYFGFCLIPLLTIFHIYHKIGSRRGKKVVR